jgi:hypothetical protein
MALGLTLGIILGVSGGVQHTSIQQTSPQAVQSLVPTATRPVVNLGSSAHHHRSGHHSSGLVLSTASPSSSGR